MKAWYKIIFETRVKEKDGKNCQIPQLIDMGAQIAQGMAYIARGSELLFNLNNIFS